MKLKITLVFLLPVLFMSLKSFGQTPPETYQLWTGGIFPKTEDIPKLQNVEFLMIKKFQRDVDGYGFLHGVALAWHKGKLYASFALNKGGENTAGEEAHWKFSNDSGKTWSNLMLIAKGAEGQSVSHGVFLSHKGKLWAFHAEFSGIMENLHTNAYLLNESTNKWEPEGTVVKNGFWPLQEPHKMKDGNWIMAGAHIGEGNPAAVAISHGDDLTKWDLVVIPQNIAGNMWGESSVIIEGEKIINIARYGEKAKALVAISMDYGRTWIASKESNLPMAGSKPYTGILSTGERYLIGTTTADGGHRRSPLTIAISRPGENSFSRIFAIRNAILANTPCESDPNAALSYPYAIELEGKLYVGYSNTAGRSGKERIYWNNNSAELAIIPIDQLKWKPPTSIIFDTDIGNDIDDALALQMLMNYQKNGKINLLGITISKSNPRTIEYIDGFCRFNNLNNIPIGYAYNGPNPEIGPPNHDVRAYLGQVLDTIIDGQKILHPQLSIKDNVPEGYVLLRKLLSAQPDTSVVLIVVGPQTNLRRLFESGPDEFSNLDGISLTKKKVKFVSVMSTECPKTTQHVGWNIAQDVASAKIFFNKCPVELIESGKMGSLILYPHESILNDFQNSYKNPLCVSYKMYIKMPYDRPTWDLTSVLFAVDPQTNCFDVSEYGHIELDSEGRSTFVPDKNGKHRYLIANSNTLSRAKQVLINCVTGK